jgi:hypothetical protein
MKRLGKALFMLSAVVLLTCTATATFVPGEYADDSSTLALYHLNQSSGTTVLDDASTGRTAHNGTVVNGTPNWTTGDFGNGLGVSMGGSTGINMGALTGLTASYTIEFYFKWNYAYIGELGNLFYAEESAFARSYLVEHGASPATFRIDYGVRKGDGGWYEIYTPADSVLDTSWHNIAFTRTWDGTNTGCMIYVDGVEKASGSFAGGFWNPTSANLYMPFSSSMGGTFDEIRVSNVARTEFGIPEPATMGLLLLGSLAVLRKRS